MPNVWQQVLGGIELPEDDGLELATRLIKGEMLYTFSDSSAKDGVGAHNHIILPRCAGGCASIQGDGVTP